MKPVLIVAALAVSLGGCSTLGGGDPTSNLPSQVLENLKGCKRTYLASVGGLGVPGGSLYIECPAAQPAAGSTPAEKADPPAAPAKVPVSQRAT